MAFDMNQCKAGDKLLSCHGNILEYVGTDERFTAYRHIVKYPDGGQGTRTDDGQTFVNRKMPEDEDIVGSFAFRGG